VARCQGIKRDGGRCTLSVPPGVQWCFNHDPALADERRRNASRAGKSGRGRGPGEITEIKDLLKDLTERVLVGDLLPGPAAVANQLTNTRLRAIEQERRLREAEDLEARIEALERSQAKPAGSVWRGAHSSNRKGG